MLGKQSGRTKASEQGISGVIFPLQPIPAYSQTHVSFNPNNVLITELPSLRYSSPLLSKGAMFQDPP